MVPRVPLLVAILAIFTALFASRFASQLQRLFGVTLLRQSNQPQSLSASAKATTTSTTAAITMATAASLFDHTKPKTPVFFMSHGGPTFMYPDDEFGEPGAYKAVSKLGRFIKTQIKPNFIVVVSAHWEGQDSIEISVPGTGFETTDGTENELIYDFYGFPDYMYKEKFHTRGSVTLAKDIKQSLVQGGLSAKLVNRGIDHGVWVPFKVAFSTNKEEGEFWDVDVPVVQVSLKKTEDFRVHRELGAILAKYRELGGLVVCSGMSVHNLKDLRHSLQLGKSMPYVAPFNELLTEALNDIGDTRFESLESLKTKHNSLYRKAHPTSEHFMPVVVAAGAADQEPAKELYMSASLSLGWGLYQFGTYQEEVKI